MREGMEGEIDEIDSWRDRQEIDSWMERWREI